MPEAITIDLPEQIWKPRQPNPLAEEERAYALLLPELLKTHREQFVAIHQGKVIASGADRVGTAKQAYALVGYVPVLVRRVSDTPPAPVVFASVWRSPLA